MKKTASPINAVLSQNISLFSAYYYAPINFPRNNVHFHTSPQLEALAKTNWILTKPCKRCSPIICTTTLSNTHYVNRKYCIRSLICISCCTGLLTCLSSPITSLKTAEVAARWHARESGSPLEWVQLHSCIHPSNFWTDSSFFYIH